MLNHSRSSTSPPMRESVERVMPAPLASSTPIKSEKSGDDEKETPENNTTASVSSTGKDPKDANAGEGGGVISLDVTLPDGQRSDISVDYNTPMLDLLVSLAAKSRLSPSGLSLVLVSEDSGKPTSYTPNQTIGSLHGRVVHIVSKDAGSGKSVNRASKKDKPFEVTQRFTVNLPTGQKTVLRVSPLTPLGDAVISACKEKDLELDLDKYVLQLPKKPGIPIDPRATILQAGVQEINLVSRENADRNYAMSMPDLSKLPPSANDPLMFGQFNGQPKKKRSFLSFLQKKDKKFKPEVRRSLVLKSTSNLDVSTPPATRTPTLPEPASPELDQNHYISRPKSMFVSSGTLPLNEKSYEQHSQTVVAPPRKKRRAPEPPVSKSHILAQQQNLSLKEGVEINTYITENISPLPEITESIGQEEVPHAAVSSLPVSYEEIFPASVQQQLNLKECVSPEADDSNHMKVHTNINANPSVNSESINGNSNMFLASENGLTKDRLHEKSELKMENSELKRDIGVPELRRNSVSSVDSDTSSTHKKTKAPIPPSPVLISSSPTLESSSTTLSSPPTKFTASIETVETPAVEDECVHLVEAHSDTSSTIKHQPDIESPAPGYQKELPTSNTSGKQEQLADSVDETDSADMSAQNVLTVDEHKNESAVMDFNDILDGVVFEEEPWSPQLALAKRAGAGAAQKDDPMMMMETASVTSEDVDEIDSASQGGRPCAFIPPPPPQEPPPPDQHPVDFEPLVSAPIFVDRGTGVNEDNTSLATSSAKSSPGQASYGGLNEMAVFIEQMNSISLENPVDKEETLLNDNTSKRDIYTPVVSSDSVSESSRLQAASWERSSDMDSLISKVNHNSSNSVVAQIITESDNIDIYSGDTSIESEEILNILPTLPPPPQFEDKFDILQEDKSFFKGKEDKAVAKVDIKVETEERKAEKENVKAVNKEEKEGHKLEKEDKNAEKEKNKAEKENNKIEIVEKNTEKGNNIAEIEVKKIEKEDKKVEEEEEEEYFSETVEELIIPLGPNGYNFAAARKKTEIELLVPPKETLKSNRNETFSAESAFIGDKPPIVALFYQLLAKTEMPPNSTLPAKKEKFVLTKEDLSKVTLLPPRSNIEKPSVDYHPSVESQPSLKNEPYVRNQPSVYISHKLPVMPNFDDSIDVSTTTDKNSYEHFQPTVVQNGFTSQSKPLQQISVSKEKPTTLPKPPSLTSNIHSDSVAVFPEDESLFSNDPLLTKSRPHLLMNSHSNPLRRSADRMRGADFSRKDVYNQRSFHAGAGSDAVADSGEQTSSVTSGYNVDTQDQQDVLQRQYLALKSQIQQWQDQLAWNQNILASQAVGSEHQTEHFQQLSDQMALQQEMAMQQLQSTLLALQQQQQQQHMPASGQDNGEPSAELAARIHQPVAGAAEPAYVAAASPLSILSSPPMQSSDLRSGVNTVKKRPKIERELEPREQLMIAIRTFSKRDLKSVPIEMTRWTSSAL